MGIIGILLLDPSRRKQPHLGGQPYGLHIQHPLTGGQHRLSQQTAHTACAFTAAVGSGKRRAPTQRIDLASADLTSQASAEAEPLTLEPWKCMR
jgi:hypothetical protein